MEMEAQKKAKTRKDYWLKPGIIVKVLNKRVGDGKYYKEKGEVVKVHDKYVGEIELSRSGDVLKLDQQDLETVIPNIGGKVLVVNGAYEGSIGRLVSVDINKFCAQIKMESGPYAGRTVDALPYEDFSKYARDS